MLWHLCKTSVWGLLAKIIPFAKSVWQKSGVAMNGSLHMCEDVQVDGLPMVFQDVAHIGMA